MDPLTALSLAVNVIAIVDFSAKLVHTTWQISKTGAKAEHVEIEDQTKVVKGLLGRLKPGLNADKTSLSQDDKDLILLCEQSEDVSSQLLKMLSTCKAKEGKSKVSMENFWRAVKSEWKEDDIKSLQKRLEDMDSKAHRLLTVRYFSRISDQLISLEVQFQVLGTTHTTELSDIRDAITALSRNGTDRGSLSQELMLKAAEKGGLGKDYAVQAGILSQLRFEEIDRRLNELNQRPSHEKSYLWLDGSHTGAQIQGQSPASFDAWLTSSEKLYWISGVPGSGKSTLMKFLYSNSGTATKLAGSAQVDKMLTAAYFFWEVGKIPLLKTQEGLLRTLLFQILRQCPELISEVYADLWTMFTDALPGAQSSLSSFAGSKVSLEVPDLLSKMKLACQYTSSRLYGLFLVIDGLDEYEGKASDIIELMSTLVALPNVKICFSSRPDNAFLDAYGTMTTKLFMEDFNKPDIKAYVQDRLERHSRFREDDDRKTLGAKLITDIVNDSSGVFLWVRLVMEDLEEGLTDRNTIAQLQKRLDRLPKELEKFFHHMLDRVHDDYREDSATMLLVTYHAHDLLPPLSCWFISERSAELERVHEIKPTESRRNNKRRSDIEFRLRSYCRGLLVVQDLPLGVKYNALPSSSLFGQKINFLHRTVREFLVQAYVAQRLDQWKPRNLDADELICKAVRAQIATSPSDANYFADDGPIAGLIAIFESHVKKLHATQPQVAVDLYQGLVEVLAAQRKANGHSLSLLQLDQAGAGAPMNPPQQGLAVPGGDLHRTPSNRSRTVAKLKGFLKGV